jgi:hypothetical protein
MPKNYGPGGGFDGNPVRYFGSSSRGYAQNILDSSTVQNAPLGAMREFLDGSQFRYALAAGAISAGQVCATDVLTASNAGPGLVPTDNSCTAAAVGATQVIVTAGALASVAADTFAGAKLITEDDAGEGYAYPIISNTAADSNAVTLSLDPAFPIKVALTTATDVAIIQNPCFEVVPATAATDCVCVGVAPTAVSDNEYFWMQTKGNSNVLCDGTPTFGDNLTLSDGETGAVQLKDAETEQLVGTALQTGASGAQVGIRLNLGW